MPSPRSTPAFRQLLDTCRPLRFEPHDIAAQLDSRGRYDLDLDREFPLSIRLFHFTSRHHTRGVTWHERLELFLPLDGPTRFRMGDAEFTLERGDILIVDNLKLHHVVDFPGFDTRVVVVTFLPEFVYSLGSPSHDYAFLLPFYSRVEGRPHLLHQADPLAVDAFPALARLVACYVEADPQFYRAGCKAHLLEVLYHLARHFRTAELLKWEFMRQQQHSLRLKPLFDHIQRNYPDRLSISGAARLVAMSAPRFTRTFKRVAGMSLVAYLNHVRLANAARLLRESDRSIADIASEVGFADQSYFDRRFKESFGQAPREFRAAALAPTAG